MAGYLLPKGIDQHRVPLFNVSEPLNFKPADFNAYWPFLSNVWEFTNESPRTKDDTQRQNYSCRCRRDAWRKRVESKGIRKREYSTLDCTASIAVITEFKGSEAVNIRVERSREKKDVGHSHNVVYSDKRSMCLGLRRIIERLLEVTPHTPDVLKMLYRDDAFECVGGKQLKYDRVGNLKHMTPCLAKFPKPGEETAKTTRRRGSPVTSRQADGGQDQPDDPSRRRGSRAAIPANDEAVSGVEPAQQSDLNMETEYRDLETDDRGGPPQTNPTAHEGDQAMQQQSMFQFSATGDHHGSTQAQPSHWNHYPTPNGVEGPNFDDNRLASLMESESARHPLNEQANFRYRSPHGAYRFG